MLVKRILFIAIVLLSLPMLALAQSAEKAEAAPTQDLNYKVQPFFPIGVWFEGAPPYAGYPEDKAGAKKYYDRCFKDISLHGFNTVAIPNCPQNLWETVLKSAQDNGLKIILEVGPIAKYVDTKPVKEAEVAAAVKQVVKQIGKYDSLLRYQVRDEPPPAAVENWLMVQKLLAAADPSRPAFSCFCSPESLNAITDKAKLTEACFDIYQKMANSPMQNTSDYAPWLDHWKACSRGNTMWVVLQTFAIDGQFRYPTAEELRSQTYLSLAAGCKGAFYFIYQSMPNHPQSLQGLIDPQGNPLSIYTPATTLAKELSVMSPLLLSLKPGTLKVSATSDARVGSYIDGQNRPVVIVASTRPDAAVDVELSGLQTDTIWDDYLTGERFICEFDPIKIPLRPGGGRVLVKEIN